MASFQYGTKLTEFKTAQFSSGSTALSAAATLYINPASTVTYINTIEIHNYGSVAGNIILLCTPAYGGNLISVPLVSSQFMNATIVGNDTLWVEPQGPYILTNQNDAIWAICSVSTMNVQLRGSTYS